MKKEQSNPVVQIFSTVLSLSVVLSTVSGPVEAAFASTANLPQFVKELTPPVQLGYVESYYKGSTEKPIILIQDLHANYGVQKKINGILEFLQPKVATAEKPMVLGTEGAWGEIDLTKYRAKSEKVKRVIGGALLKESELTGMEYFAINTPQPVQFFGIDNKEDYVNHRDLYLKTLPKRLDLVSKLEKMRTLMLGSKDNASRTLKKLWRIESDYQEGRLDLPRLAKALNVPAISNYGEAEAILLQKKQEAALQENKKMNSVMAKNVSVVDHDFSLLSRLLRQQLTLEEVQFVVKQLPQTLSIISSLMPEENIETWKEVIRTSVDYYGVALLRDEPLANNTRQIAEKNTDRSVVVMAGGFHSAGITEVFRKAGMSYVVIAPLVSSHSLTDEIVYLERLSGKHATLSELAIPAGMVKANTLAQPSATAGQVSGAGDAVNATPLGDNDSANRLTLAGRVSNLLANTGLAQLEFNIRVADGALTLNSTSELPTNVQLGDYQAALNQAVTALKKSGELDAWMATLDNKQVIFTNRVESPILNKEGKILIPLSFLEAGNELQLFLAFAKETLWFNGQSGIRESKRLIQFAQMVVPNTTLNAMQDALGTVGYNAAPLLRFLRLSFVLQRFNLLGNEEAYHGQPVRRLVAQVAQKVLVTLHRVDVAAAFGPKWMSAEHNRVPSQARVAEIAKVESGLSSPDLLAPAHGNAIGKLVSYFGDVSSLLVSGMTLKRKQDLEAAKKRAFSLSA